MPVDDKLTDYWSPQESSLQPLKAKAPTSFSLSLRLLEVSVQSLEQVKLVLIVRPLNAKLSWSPSQPSWEMFSEIASSPFLLFVSPSAVECRDTTRYCEKVKQLKLCQLTQFKSRCCGTCGKA